MAQYSIIIPAYNEGARLGGTLDRVLNHITDRRWDAEVIVVNDGSRDNTAELVRARAKLNPEVRLIENPGTIRSIDNFLQANYPSLQLLNHRTDPLR